VGEKDRIRDGKPSTIAWGPRFEEAAAGCAAARGGGSIRNLHSVAEVSTWQHALQSFQQQQQCTAQNRTQNRSHKKQYP
jgi:hypothetical protein